MNVWAIVAVIAAFIFGWCVGYIIAYHKESKCVDELLRYSRETSDKLAKLSKEYDEFLKAANEIDRWPQKNPHISMKTNLADYLKRKYLETEFNPDCEDESDNLYV